MTRRSLPYWITAAIVLGAALWLLWIGRAPICDCGVVKLWYGQTMTSEGSQHLTDWYTPSHILHGILFYGLLWLVARRLPFSWRLVIATAVEAIKLGASHYLAKPSNTDDIEAAFGLDEGNTEVALTNRSSSIKTLEWERIHEVLAESDFNISEAARRLGMHRRTLSRKLEKHRV